MIVMVMPAEETDDIEFTNRTYEQAEICRPGASQFILLQGAAGYGKTRLLKRVKRTYLDRNPGWQAILVDLKSEAQIASADLFIALPAIARAIVQELPAPAQMPPIAPARDDLVALQRNLSQRLGACLAVQQVNLLLLFDGVEVLSDAAANWLRHIVAGDLLKGLRYIQHDLRAVFAGRFVTNWERDRSFGSTLLPLSVFNQRHVQDMISIFQRNRRMGAITPEFLEKLSWWILNLSGGHPGSIRDILEVNAITGFFLPDFEDAFGRQQFAWNGKEGTLLELCVEPFVEEIWQNVDKKLRLILETLSPIRHFDQDLLVALFDENIIQSPDYANDWALIDALLSEHGLSTGDGALSHHDAVWALIKLLRKTYLVSPPNSVDPMYADYVVRRMLAKKMELTQRPRFQRISSLALRVFDQWAFRMRMDAEVRRTSILECLYLSLQVEPAGAGQNDIQAHLQSRLKRYLARIQQRREHEQLMDALQKDQELSDLITYRAGPEVRDALLTTIHSFFETEG